MSARDNLSVFIVLLSSRSESMDNPSFITNGNLEKPPQTRHADTAQFDPIFYYPFRLSVLVNDNSTALHALIVATIFSFVPESRVVKQPLKVGKIRLVAVRAYHLCYSRWRNGCITDEEQFGTLWLRTSTRVARF